MDWNLDWHLNKERPLSIFRFAWEKFIRIRVNFVILIGSTVTENAMFKVLKINLCKLQLRGIAIAIAFMLTDYMSSAF